MSNSIKYKKYQETIRERQIERAKKIIQESSKINKKNANDPKRFVSQNHSAKDGEVADKTVTFLNKNQIENEARPVYLSRQDGIIIEQQKNPANSLFKSVCGI